MVIGFDLKMTVKSYAIEIVFKSWELIRIHQLVSTAKQALFSEFGWTACAD